MKPETSYKPKTTIIPCHHDLFVGGLRVIAWEIEDGRIVQAITFDAAADIEASVQRAPVAAGSADA